MQRLGAITYRSCTLAFLKPAVIDAVSKAFSIAGEGVEVGQWFGVMRDLSNIPP